MEQFVEKTSKQLPEVTIQGLKLHDLSLRDGY